MEKNNRKPLIALAIIALVGIIGGTFAYFTTSADFTNVFKTKTYSTKAEETFESPSNWTPGTETTKKVEVTNTGGVDVAVRVWYEETWVENDTAGNATTKALPLEQDGKKVSLVNLADDNTDWLAVSESGRTYYYYKNVLAPNAKTSSFIKSVTFNPQVVNKATCTTDEDNVRVCTSTAGYDNATYTLTIHVETVQFDAYDTFWNTAVVLGE